jgi:hypothetical protein
MVEADGAVFGMHECRAFGISRFCYTFIGEEWYSRRLVATSVNAVARLLERF